jgi:hypothetical protein
MKLTLATFLALSILLLLGACSAAPKEAEPAVSIEPQKEAPPEQAREAPPQTTPVPNQEPFPGKIAIINDHYSDEQYYHAAHTLVEKYGSDKIMREYWPGIPFGATQEPYISLFNKIAADPEVYALIVNPAIQDLRAALDAVQKKRKDLFVAAGDFYGNKNTTRLAKRANLIIMQDDLSMGPALAQQAHKLGAKTLVHYSFPRYMEHPPFSARRDLIREECAGLGIKFVDAEVRDPADGGGRAGAALSIQENVPKQVAKYGKDTAFFCTNPSLQAPLIYAVVEEGAIYPQPDTPSPYLGFPMALGLIDADEWSIGYTPQELLPIDYVISETARVLKEKNMLGRVSTWPVPVSMLITQAGFDYAVKWLNGEVPKEGIDLAVLKQCMEDYAGVECYIRTYVDEDGVEYPNVILVREEYLTYGEEHIKSD